MYSLEILENENVVNRFTPQFFIPVEDYLYYQWRILYSYVCAHTSEISQIFLLPHLEYYQTIICNIFIKY